MIGYSPNKKAFKLWNKILKKVVFSRHVKFDETYGDEKPASGNWYYSDEAISSEHDVDSINEFIHFNEKKIRNPFVIEFDREDIEQDDHSCPSRTTSPESA